MCEVCKLLQGDRVVAQEGPVVVVLTKSASPAAHVIPKQHAPLSELPPETQQRLFQVAGTVSSMIFDNVGVHGTNILVHDGEHARYTVVGRMEEDKLDLRWQPTRATPDQLEATASKISAEAWYIGKRPEGKIEITRAVGPSIPTGQAEMTLPHESEETQNIRETAKAVQDRVREGPKAEKHGEEHNYLLKQLTRRR